MKIKRFIGSTTQEAMYKLKKELGSNAVILHTRKIKQPGFLGVFKKSLVEVVAGLDDEKNEQKVDTSGTSILYKEGRNPHNSFDINNYSVNQNDNLGKEIKDLREMMKGIVDSLDTTMKKELP